MMTDLFGKVIILCLILCAPYSSSQLVEESQENDKLVQNKELKFGKLTVPENYDPFQIPSTDDEPLSVQVSFTIRSILDIDQNNGQITVDANFGMKWRDVRIYPNENETFSGLPIEYITVDSRVLRSLWKPDISIEQLASIERSSITSKLVELVVKDDGEFSYYTRATMKLACDFNFKFFPADSHNCPFHIRSFSYPENELELTWQEDGHAYLEDTKHPNWDLMIDKVEPLEPFNKIQNIVIEEQLDGRYGNYTVLTFSIKARRKLSYHIVQTYLPSFLLIMITWTCFLLPSGMVEARVGISMTTVLTLTALFSSVRERSPDVSYTMAIDIWMLFSIFLVFITLLIFTSIYWMKRALAKRKDKDQTEDPKEFDASLHRSIERYRRTMKFTKNYAFWIFAVLFSLFVIVYWVCLIIDSRYLNFQPNSDFNRGVEKTLCQEEGRYIMFERKYGWRGWKSRNTADCK